MAADSEIERSRVVPRQSYRGPVAYAPRCSGTFSGATATMNRTDSLWHIFESAVESTCQSQVPELIRPASEARSYRCACGNAYASSCPVVCFHGSVWRSVRHWLDMIVFRGMCNWPVAHTIPTNTHLSDIHWTFAHVRVCLLAGPTRFFLGRSRHVCAVPGLWCRYFGRQYDEPRTIPLTL